MSQRESGYERIELDAYETPFWVTTALLPHLPPRMEIWEPAAGTGKMARVLLQAGHYVVQTDIFIGMDFLLTDPACEAMCKAIITNPPYTLAQKFIEHALALTEKQEGLVAMLLRTDYDHAASRQHLFGKCLQFSQKIVLTKRIKWFEDSKGQPSFNHAWYLWSWKHSGLPTLVYGP
jgi:hypothetical protein